MAEANHQAVAAGLESPLLEVRRRKGTAAHPGERGQVRSNFYYWIAELGLPNPDRLDVATYRKMLRDPMVRAGLQLREMATLGKSPTFNYAPRDDKDAGEKARGAAMVDFLDHVWERLAPGGVRFLRLLLSARIYGFSVVEKVWATSVAEDGTPLLRLLPPGSPFAGYAWIERVKLLPPETLHKNGLSTDEYGNLLAVIQTLLHYPRPAEYRYVGGSVPVGDATRLGRVVFRGDDLDRVLLYTANFEDANRYGVSDLQACYNAWYSKQSNVAARNILLERLSGVIVGKYATATGQKALEDALDKVGPGSVLTVPGGDEVDLLKGWEQAVQGYHQAIEYDDRQILQALLVPPLTLGGQAQETGSFARAASNFDSFLLAVRQLQLELEQVVEEGIVRPLIDANWGPQATYPTFDFPELAEKDRAALAAVWSAAIRDGYVDPAIDAAWLRQEMGVPEEAPPGHVFERPQPVAGPSGLPGEVGRVAPPFGAPRSATAAAQAAPEAPQASRFDDAEAPAANGLVVEHYENLLKTRLSEAGLDLLPEVLLHVPDGPEGVDALEVPPATFRRVFADVLRDVLDRVLADVADKFDALGEDEAARRVRELAAPATAARAPKPRRRRAAAQAAPDALEALQAYLRYAAQWSDAKGAELAEGLQSRLRLRALESWHSGLALDEIRKVLAAEFTTYLSNQIDTVARTTVMDSFNTARNVAYEGAGDFIQGLRFHPLLDNFTTPFCRGLINRSIRKGDPNYAKLASPPFFHNCRTITVPILAGEEWTFDGDWEAWLEDRRGVDGGGFLYA